VGHAVRLRDHHELDFEIAVDDIDGTLHRKFSPKPNSAYVINTDATIAYRAHWANDEQGLHNALEAVASGRAPARGSSRKMIRPLMRAVGHLPGIVHGLDWPYSCSNHLYLLQLPAIFLPGSSKSRTQTFKSTQLSPILSP
jgi:hypothetical protein